MKESGFKDIRENAPRELRRTYIAEQRAAAVAEKCARLRKVPEQHAEDEPRERQPYAAASDDERTERRNQSYRR